MYLVSYMIIYSIVICLKMISIIRLNHTFVIFCNMLFIKMSYLYIRLIVKDLELTKF